MLPEDIGYMTELDKEYSRDLYEIGLDNSKAACGQFQGFLDKYQYWIDDESKKLSGNDWERMCFLVADCRSEKIVPEDMHKPAMSLMMPEKIFKVSITANRFKVCWGCAYIRLKEEGLIEY